MSRHSTRPPVDPAKTGLAALYAGLVFTLLPLWGLFHNEGRALDISASLDRAMRIIATADPNLVDPANDGRLVYLTGKATTDKILADRPYGMAVHAIRFERKAQMYQWMEVVTRDSFKPNRSVHYSKVWSAHFYDSSRYDRRYRNPSKMAVQSSAITADPVMLGRFTLSPKLTSQIGGAVKVPVSKASLARIDERFRNKMLIDKGDYYLGSDPENPRIGEVRVSYRAILPRQDVTVVARQAGAALEPFVTSTGHTIEQLKGGLVSRRSMLMSAFTFEHSNVTAMRFAYFAILMLGVWLLIGPLVAIFDQSELLASLAAMRRGNSVPLMSIPLAFPTMALAQLYHGGGLNTVLLAVSVLCAAMLVILARR